MMTRCGGIAPAPAWVAAWIGAPFVHGARGPDAYDCWGLVRAVAESEFGLALPLYAAETPACGRELAAIAAAMCGSAETNWLPVPVADVKSGDVMMIRRHGLPCHVGLVAAPGWLLHTTAGSGARLERLDRPALIGCLVCGYRWLLAS